MVSPTPLPEIDAGAHLDTETLAARFDALPPAPRDQGVVTWLMGRNAAHDRLVYDRVRLTVDEGMPGDRWFLDEGRDPDEQLAVMADGVARMIANGQPLALFGDNLALDFDLSADNLPIGTRLALGEAVLEVTPMPHGGCNKYAARFGLQALAFISKPARRDLKLRGIYLKVVEAGEVWIGAPVRVLSRPPMP